MEAAVWLPAVWRLERFYDPLRIVKIFSMTVCKSSFYDVRFDRKSCDMIFRYFSSAWNHSGYKCSIAWWSWNVDRYERNIFIPFTTFHNLSRFPAFNKQAPRLNRKTWLSNLLWGINNSTKLPINHFPMLLTADVNRLRPSQSCCANDSAEILSQELRENLLDKQS